jgi:hypothetical protein
MPRRRKPLEQGKLMAVTLVCLSCGKERGIHVPRERGVKERAYWECFECQGPESDSPRRGRKDFGKDKEKGKARSDRAESEEKE